MVITSLPFVANSGITSATRWSGDTAPSPSSSQNAPTTRALVQEKMT